MTLLAENDRICIAQLAKGRDYETLRVSIPAGITLNMGEAVEITTPANGTDIAVIGELTDVSKAKGIMAGYYDTATEAGTCEGIMIVVAPYGLEKKYIKTPVGDVKDIVIANVPFTDTTDVQGELA